MSFIEPLANSNESADKELYGEYEQRYRDASHSFGIEAGQLLVEIPQILPSVTRHEHYHVLSELISIVNESAKAGALLIDIAEMDIEQASQQAEDYLPRVLARSGQCLAIFAGSDQSRVF